MLLLVDIKWMILLIFGSIYDGYSKSVTASKDIETHMKVDSQITITIKKCLWKCLSVGTILTPPLEPVHWFESAVKHFHADTEAVWPVHRHAPDSMCQRGTWELYVCASQVQPVWRLLPSRDWERTSRSDQRVLFPDGPESQHLLFLN